ncbi:type III secretion system effector protein [Morganella morganii]|uniref:type III secretion system effector protein n=1 Tax=Morganella morganii TaxID=582 RepID=UPI0021D0534D|nr:type III secretion system effector protein [Morganella morganii]MCU6375524.1 type III secretion system effector protein [Morganella morganii]
MCKVVFPEIHNVNIDVEKIGNPINPLFSVNGSVNVQGSSEGTPDITDFLAGINERLITMLMLINKLRDALQLINQKKQVLGWGLEVNALQQNVKAIDSSFYAAVYGAVCGIIGGVLTVSGAVMGVSCGEVWTMIGKAVGQMVNNAGALASGSKTREADQEKAIGGLQNQGAQSYVKTQDDSLVKGNEINKHSIDFNSNIVEQEGQMLRALFRY